MEHRGHPVHRTHGLIHALLHHLEILHPRPLPPAHVLQVVPHGIHAGPHDTQGVLHLAAYPPSQSGQCLPALITGLPLSEPDLGLA